MRICVLFIAVVSLCLAGCGDDSAKAVTQPALTESLPPNLLARWHFSGNPTFARDGSGAALHKLLALPETAAFQDSLLQKLSKAPFQVLLWRTADSTNDFAAELRPLLDDLVATESCGEIVGDSNQITQAAVAVRLTDERATAWSATLSNILANWTAITPAAVSNSPMDWQLSKHHFPNILRAARAGDWLVLGMGQDRLPLVDELVGRIRSTGHPRAAKTADWFSATVDASWVNRLMKSNGATLPAGTVTLAISGTNNEVRTDGRFIAHDRLDWHPEKWVTPSNLICGPIISFTAAQGLAAKLAELTPLQQFGLPPPDQFFMWALPNNPFKTYVAVPMADVTNALAGVAPQIITAIRTNRSTARVGIPRYDSATATLLWDGLPFIEPKIEAVQDSGSGFFLISLLPHVTNSLATGSALLAKVHDRHDLAYYDWEVTGQRLSELRGAAGWVNIANGQYLSATNDAAQKWLDIIEPKLSNAETEISLTSPKELTLRRTSTIGFTAMEIAAFTEWVRSYDIKQLALPARPKKRPQP